MYYNFPGRYVLSDYSELFTFIFRTNLYRITDHYFKNKNFITASKEGWGTGFNSENSVELEESSFFKANNHLIQNLNSPKQQAIFESNISALNEILSLCKERNIEVLLFIPPASKEYGQKLNAKQLNITINTLEKISREFDNCHYHNLLKDDQYTSKDFYDADHLSEIGAKKLSKWLQQKIQ